MLTVGSDACGSERDRETMGAVLLSVKPYVAALYGAFGLFLLWSASPSGVTNMFPVARPLDRRSGPRPFLASAGLLVTITFLVAGSQLLICALGIAIAAILLRPDGRMSHGTLLDAGSISAITLSLVWWRIKPSVAAPLPLAVFALILVTVSLSLRGGWGGNGRSVWRLPIALFFVAGIALVTDLGGYRSDWFTITTLLHHWGAFIGPPVHIQAGLVPFYDMPLQYGLGPTIVLVVAGQIGNYWSGAHALFALADIVMASLVLAMALTTRRQRDFAWTCAVTTSVFAAAFLWPGFPVEGSILMLMPSASGIRFLPVTVVACFWFFDRPLGATLSAILSVLWSPESAVMTLAVYTICASSSLGLRAALIVSGVLLLSSYTSLIILHHAVFGVWMDPAAFLEYVMHVPGPLPIDPTSDVLLLASVLGVGGWLVFTAPDLVSKRRDLATTALLFASACFYFGRSHPNNVCNLAPFLVLVGVRALDREQNAHRAIIAHGLAVSVAALAFSPWRIRPLDPHINIGIGNLVAAFPAFEADVAGIRNGIPRTPQLGIADFGPYYTRHPAETVVWTPMDPSSLWLFVPSERRKLYITRSAQRLGRSGWGIFAENQRVMLDDLRAGYDVKVERSIAVAAGVGGSPVTYAVACFDPKPALVATRTGPACPDIDGEELSATLVAKTNPTVRDSTSAE